MRRIVAAGSRAAELYGYGEVRTPLLEQEALFSRALGLGTDVVSKEMYTLDDRNGKRLALRPEATAGVLRAFLASEHGGGAQHEPQRYWYHGPMFRYERPQRGRYRQFEQFGVECFGSGGALADAEVIALAAQFLRDVGVLGGTTLRINSLGDAASQQAYRAVLGAYFEQHAAALSETSRERLQRGSVLRILDSKSEADRALVERAPKLAASLTAESSERFGAVVAALGALGVELEVDETLVRGLDYYCHTVFEFVGSGGGEGSGLGTQDAVLGGGRYDGLSAALGGPDELPSIGWSAGLERLLLMASELDAFAAPAEPHVAVLAASANGTQQSSALALATELRRAGIAAAWRPDGGKLGKQLSRASASDAVLALIVGADELRAGTVTLKLLGTGEQCSVERGAVLEHVSAAVGAAPTT